MARQFSGAIRAQAAYRLGSATRGAGGRLWSCAAQSRDDQDGAYETPVCLPLLSAANLPRAFSFAPIVSVAISSWQAYQDTNGSSWPSSPWPREQTGQQDAAVTTGSNGSHPGASTASSSSSAAGGSNAAAQRQRGQQQQEGWPEQRVRAYRGLSASQFQHPLDQQNTALLRALPGLELLARNMMVRRAAPAPAPACLPRQPTGR